MVRTMVIYFKLWLNLPKNLHFLPFWLFLRLLDKFLRVFFAILATFCLLLIYGRMMHNGEEISGKFH